MLRPINSYNIISQPQFMSKKRGKKVHETKDPTTKPLIIAGAALTTAFGVTAAIISNKQSPTKLANEIIALKNEMSKYTEDVSYRKNILKSMNLPQSDYYKLYSIIGTEELDVVVKKLSTDKKAFLPGKKTFRLDKEPIFTRENVESGKFTANMHIHTHYSDGTLTVPELLEQAVNYANKRVEKQGKGNPFYLAITDHDTLEGCKEAVQIIYKNPDKYKNLRLILGVENTVRVNNSQFLNGEVEVHMISYGINPFDKELNNYYSKQIQQNRENIQTALNNTNEKYFNVLKNYQIDYNLKEFDKLAPQLKYRNMPSNYLTKDYLQFKLIYSSMVEKNTQFIEEVGLKPEMLDFTSPLKLIEQNPDYSKGQKYYEYYLEAVKKDLKSKLPIDKHAEIEKHLRFIPEEIIPILEDFEAAVGNTSSDLYVANVEFPNFEEAIKFLAQKEGSLGIAHPGVVFPMKNLKSNSDTINFYDSLYADFKIFGKDKAKYAEDNYATYFENQTEQYLQDLSVTSSKYNLEKTGGLDTHISDIFSSK